jgi:hypothetical protein
VGIKMQSSAQGPFAENRGFTHARFGLGTAGATVGRDLHSRVYKTRIAMDSSRAITGRGGMHSAQRRISIERSL